MSDEAEKFSSMIRQRLDALGTTAFAVETAHALPKDTVRNVLREGIGKSGPTLSKVKQICEALGLDFYIGPPRESGPIEHVRLDSRDYVHIPLHDALLAAGAGAANADESIIDHLAIRQDWLKRLGVNASAARLAQVHGDSMQPTLWDGDMVMVDTASPQPRPRIREPRDRRRSPIYALIDDGQARIKRIERPSVDQMLLISDNPDYMPELRQGSDIQAIKIIGKVVWWGHTAKE